MEKLHFLLTHLSKPQRKILQVHLKYLSVRKDSDTQIMKLAGILLNCGDDVPTLEECSRLIYGRMNYSAIQKIKSRLLQKVKSLLVFDAGMEKSGETRQGSDYQGIAIRWQTTLFQILSDRLGDTPLLRSTLNEIIRLSKTYEYYPTLVEMLYTRKWMTLSEQDAPNCAKLNEEINHYQRCGDVLAKARDYYAQAVLRSDSHSHSEKKALESFLKDCIAELNAGYRFTRSPLVAYYIQLLEIRYCMSSDNIAAVKELCNELLEIIRSNRSVYSSQHLADAYMYMGTCHIRLGEYDRAAEDVQCAQKLSARNSENYLAALELEFFARFYQKDIEKSKTVCLKLIKSIKPEPGNFRYSKYLFFQANICFLQGRFSEAQALLNIKFVLPRDKSGWDISVRLMRILLFLEMEKVDEAGMHFISLSRHVSRSSQGNEVDSRTKLILRILRMLYQEGFSVSGILPKLNHLREMLSSQSTCLWEPLSSELIPFERWLKRHYKLNGKTSRAELV
jgi:tetratricopeptide (TPR) repeat protein